MNICLDSSGWIEIFVAGANANHFAEAGEKESLIVVPSIVIYEVRRYALHRFGLDAANDYWSTMIAQHIVDLDANLAAAAAEIAKAHRLAMADAIIYATAVQAGCELWTQDAHFERLDGVRYFPKTPAI